MTSEGKEERRRTKQGKAGSIPGLGYRKRKRIKGKGDVKQVETQGSGEKRPRRDRKDCPAYQVCVPSWGG